MDYLFLLEQLLLTQPQPAKQPPQIQQHQTNNNNNGSNNSSSGSSGSSVDASNGGGGGGIGGGSSELELLSQLMTDHVGHTDIDDHDHYGDDDNANSATECDGLRQGQDSDGDLGPVSGPRSSSSSSPSSSSPSSSSLSTSPMCLAERVMRCLEQEESEVDDPSQGNNDHERPEQELAPGQELAPVHGLTRPSFRRLWMGAGCESETMAREVGARVQTADREW